LLARVRDGAARRARADRVGRALVGRGPPRRRARHVDHARAVPIGRMKELVEKAEAAAARAYAPYSNYLVGAVVRARDGREFTGVNVESAAYPLGVCAEKSAIDRKSVV